MGKGCGLQVFFPRVTSLTQKAEQQGWQLWWPRLCDFNLSQSRAGARSNLQLSFSEGRTTALKCASAELRTRTTAWGPGILPGLTVSSSLKFP
jgi:hypothetical protein